MRAPKQRRVVRGELLRPDVATMRLRSIIAERIANAIVLSQSCGVAFVDCRKLLVPSMRIRRGLQEPHDL
ncbi:hypothetical protein C5689_02170 [Methylosinus sporium]|uniref:Uncharacterized protein n=1 Tax=Methylosinus sporium TaxID=428 RepID=A0A2U1SUT2_METSR|nr:hypothetical protein C5689_02170 [Methylosinus sporium]